MVSTIDMALRDMATLQIDNKVDKITLPTKLSMNGILEVDEINKSITVEPYVTARCILAIISKLKLTLPCAPNNLDVTVAEMIQNGSVSSSSKKYGLFHHIITNYEVLTASGKVISAKKTKDGAKGNNNAMFYGIPMSKQSIGSLLSVTIRLIEQSQFVLLTVHPVKLANISEEMLALAETYKHLTFMDTIFCENGKGLLVFGEFARTKPAALTPFTNWNTFTKLISKTEQEEEYYMDYQVYLDRYKDQYSLKHIYSGTAKETLYRFITIDNDYLVPLENYNEIATVLSSWKVTPVYLTLVNVPSLPGIFRQQKGRNLFHVYIKIRQTISKKTFNASLKNCLQMVEERAIELGGICLMSNRMFMNEAAFWKMFDASLYRWIRMKYGSETIVPSLYDQVLVDA
uniref:FAD-binding PCMH-type domain-containing protein n=1 Tax=Rhabditophanes sp. KR3021 TaxID=114890 RepID=A0AC35TX79_9BILA